MQIGDRRLQRLAVMPAGVLADPGQRVRHGQQFRLPLRVRLILRLLEALRTVALQQRDRAVADPDDRLVEHDFLRVLAHLVQLFQKLVK